MELSICIPTYNRPKFLYKCLQSIKFAATKSTIKLEVCISDNNSDSNISEIVNEFKNYFEINFFKHDANLGFALNYIHCLKMASGEFIWTIGDDDIILPNSLQTIKSIIDDNKDIDFIYINSLPYNNEKYSYKSLIENKLDIKNVKNKSKKMKFFSLLDPKIIRDDFFQGMFLAAFRSSKIINFENYTNLELLKDKRVWSNFDNTCLHIKMYANSFKNSFVFFQSQYLSLNLYGHKEWSPMQAFIYIIRIPENIEYFRENGLGFFQYLNCKNFALKNFFPYLFHIFKNYNTSGAKLIKFNKHILPNLIYPSIYINLILFIFKKILQNITNIKFTKKN